MAMSRGYLRVVSPKEQFKFNPKTDSRVTTANALRLYTNRHIGLHFCFEVFIYRPKPRQSINFLKRNFSI